LAKVLQAPIEPESRPLAEPHHALFGAAVREGIRIACPVDIFCSRSSPTAESRAKSGLDIALLEQAALLRRMRPNPGSHRPAIQSSRIAVSARVDFCSCQLAQLALYAQNILHVVAQFVREHVGLREFARRPEPALQFVKETEIN